MKKEKLKALLMTQNISGYLLGGFTKVIIVWKAIINTTPRVQIRFLYFIERFTIN